MLRRFYLEPKQIYRDKFHITDDQIRHIRNVLRMNPGDQIEIVNGQGDLYTGEITKTSKEFIAGKILDKEHFFNDDVTVTIAQALGKSDKFEEVIDSVSQLGIHGIIPLETEYCIKKAGNIQKKQVRWNKINVSAFKQSRSLFMMNIYPVMKFNELKENFTDFDLIIALHPASKKSIHEVEKKLTSAKNILIIIGPEGGLSPKEVRSIGDDNLYNLSGNILKTETTPVVIVSVIEYLLKKL